MHSRLLTAQDGAEYQQLRLKALQTDPTAFLAVFEQESQKHEASFAQELEFAYHPPTFGYYGMFVPNLDDQGEKLVGFLQLAPSFLPKQQHIAFLFNLYVDPPFRGQDIALQLWQHSLTQLKSHYQPIERVFLSCLDSNTPALEFYKKIGFKLCGTQPSSVKWQGQYSDQIEMVCLT